ncbi:hypothetical protein [Allorhodopirellula solitaria]|uniref:Uncharacterized protein n=1 Tax=Allorhodopirellula solitaria TaxID=2527987 RepID=A0A5C5XW85_9BACT|nr:hypothetical protein [Allorhodopirellula solitaria]TWT67587.1 hypothetical protein CA85_24400 [Allorhodopirellula solitaria]
MFQPSWVTEQCLAFGAFNCCGDEDLLPFKCVHCGTLFVLCCECETLYTDLYDLTQRRFPNLDDYSCPSCSREFGDIFRDPVHRTAFPEWDSAQLAHLISVPPRDDFIQILTASTDQMIDFLSRGMRSTARQRSLEFRIFAESIVQPLESHASQRDTAYAHCDGLTLKQASQWLSTLDPLDRAFATLGVLDRFIPEVRGG